MNLKTEEMHLHIGEHMQKGHRYLQTAAPLTVRIFTLRQVSEIRINQ
jgi:hypothetical protein